MSVITIGLDRDGILHHRSAGGRYFREENITPLLEGGRWTTKAKTRFQVLESQLMMRNAANDDCYSTHEQLELRQCPLLRKEVSCSMSF